MINVHVHKKEEKRERGGRDLQRKKKKRAKRWEKIRVGEFKKKESGGDGNSCRHEERGGEDGRRRWEGQVWREGAETQDGEREVKKSAGGRPQRI